MNINTYLVDGLHTLNKFKEQPVFLTIIELNILMRISQLGQVKNIHLQNHILSRIAFILSQLSSNFTLNYIPRHKDYLSEAQSYPDDIDDTFSFLYTLQILNPTLITAEHIANLLISLESIRSAEKPYLFNTWYADISKPSWQSIDPVVLSSIAAFFKNQNILSSELSDYVFRSIIDFNEIDMCKCIDENMHLGFTCSCQSSSEFYHSYPLALYLVTRLIFDESKSEILVKQVFNKILLLHKNKDIAGPNIHIHFLFASLFHIYKAYPHLPIFTSISKHIIFKQVFDINFFNTEILEFDTPAIPTNLYIESVQSNTYTFQTSSYIDSLIKYESQLGYEYFRNDLNTKPISSELELSKDSIYQEYMENICSLIPGGKIVSQTLIAELISSKDFQICKDIAISSLDQNLNPAQTEHIKKLLNMHILGLVTYYIYDKVIDEEYAADYISVFEHLQILFRRRLRRITKKKKFVYEKILMQTDIFYVFQGDKININLTRADEYKYHYNKSFGSCIVPLFIYPEFEAELKRFYKHYLLARQLLDDFKDYTYDKKLNKYTTMKSFELRSENNLLTDKNSNLNIQAIFNAIDEELNEAKISAETISSDLKHILLQYTEELISRVYNCRFELSVLREIKKRQITKEIILN